MNEACQLPCHECFFDTNASFSFIVFSSRWIEIGGKREDKNWERCWKARTGIYLVSFSIAGTLMVNEQVSPHLTSANTFSLWIWWVTKVQSCEILRPIFCDFKYWHLGGARNPLVYESCWYKHMRKLDLEIAYLTGAKNLSTYQNLWCHHKRSLAQFGKILYQWFRYHRHENDCDVWMLPITPYSNLNASLDRGFLEKHISFQSHDFTTYVQDFTSYDR